MKTATGLTTSEIAKLSYTLDERGATLSSQGRKRVRDSNFAIPETRSYPIHDIAHARNALSRVAQHGSDEEKRRVRAAVCRKYPTLCSDGS